jgi:hypothetical protein
MVLLAGLKACSSNTLNGGLKMRALVPIALVVGLGLVVPVAAQDSDPAQRALEYAAAQQDNLKTLKTYSWKTRSEVSRNEALMLVALVQARFDAEGELQHTRISSESHVEQKRGLRGRKQKQELEKLGGLIEEVLSVQVAYILMSKGQLVDFFDKATFADGTGEMEGTQEIRATNVLVAGDELTIWVDPSTGLNRKLMIKTPLDEQSVVEGTMDYKTMEGGPNTASVSHLEVKSQGIVIKSERFDFIKQL